MTRLLPAGPALARPRRFLASLPHGLPTAMTFALSLGVVALSSALVIHANLLSPPRRPTVELATGGMGAPGWSVWHGASTGDASPRPDSTQQMSATVIHPSPTAGRVSASAGAGSTGSYPAGAGSGKNRGAIGNPGPSATDAPGHQRATPEPSAGPSSTPEPSGDDQVPTLMPSPDPEHDVPQPAPTRRPRHEGTQSPATPPPTSGAPSTARTPEPSETPEPTQTPEPPDH